MIGQPMHIISGKSSCIDLLLTTSSKLLSEVGIKQTIYDKCHHSIIYGSLIPQLLSITHEIDKSFDCNASVDVRGTFFRYHKSLWQGLA